MGKAAPAKANGSEGAEQTEKMAKKTPLVLKAEAFALADFARNTWEVTMPAGSAPGDLLEQPAALGVMAMNMKNKHLIYAQPEDAAWMAIYRVMAVDGNSVQVALLDKYDLPARVHHGETDPPGFEIDRDDVHGWHIVRKADGVMMGEQRTNPDLRSWEACRRYVFDHPSVRGPRAPVYS